MEWIFFWAICGIVSAVVASNKGRSAAGWFFIGLLLGPIGVVLSLVVAKNQQAIEEQAVRDGASRKCPFCAELVKAEAIICKHCGRDLPPVPVKQEKVITLTGAVEDGDWATASRLLRTGADVDEVDAEGRSPLALAIARNDKQIIDLLRSNGAMDDEGLRISPKGGTSRAYY